MKRYCQAPIFYFFRLFPLFFIYQIHCSNISFVPQPIHITVADLPPPFATSSAYKGPRVIPVPIDPFFYVPDGFTVKLYASDLVGPRYLIYTPSGDILVSESPANRISCLIDNDHDGYPDKRVTFADSSNGLSYPFGMAFFNEQFVKC